MGGVTRMTISLVVIIIEITHDMEALLPIMLVAVVAKWTGDMFGHSLYDEQLHIGKNIFPPNFFYPPPKCFMLPPKFFPTNFENKS
jgi:chloride channel 6